jgi:putative aldouronate transport system substrate-binding protein
MINKWITNGYTKRINDIEKSMNDGSLASFIDTWDAAQQYTRFTATDKYTWKVFPLYPNMKSEKLMDTIAMSVSKNSKNVKKVLYFLEWIQSSQDNYDLFMYGIKDKHYKLNNDRLEYISEENPYVGWSGSYAFLNFNLMRLNPSDSSNYKEIYMENVSLNSHYPPTIGFTPDKSAISNLLILREQKFSEFENRLFLNGVEQSQIDTFVKEQEVVSSNIANNLQDQIDEWNDGK